MKRLPLILLGLMALLFFLTLGRPEAWAGWLHAFAEAGMVGAFADWFAVVALFRHPLGLPIPHTAIIPRRKDEIGDNLARFVGEHFLDPDVVRAKLNGSNLARNTAVWLKSPSGRDRVAQLAVRATAGTLGALSEERVRQFIARLSGREFERLELAVVVGRGMEWLIEDGRHQDILTQSLRHALVLVHENRNAIRANVQRESPWWLPGFVDDRMVVQMLDRIETLLLEMSLFLAWGRRVKQDLLANSDLQEYLFRLWSDLAAGLQEDLQRPDSRFREQVGDLVGGFADELDRDEEMQAWLNGWLVESGVALVDDNREAIASLISDTVRSWDPAETSQRIESAIGRDLQFIRVNGTLVGGIVGLFIHAIKLF
jgi:uncharacterized membrane-anchored protein YjiN (DUF445 family)